MRILLCHNHYQQPGGEDQVYRDERWLLESHGHEVQALIRHNNAIPEMSGPRVALNTLWSTAAYREALQLIRRFRPDVMHCTNTFPLISPAVYYAARSEGVPVVQSLHNYRMHCTTGYLLRDGAPCEACHGKLFSWPALRHACYRNSLAATSVVVGMQTLHRCLGTWHKAVNLYITCSHFAREKFLQAGLPKEKVVVKPNFVHPDCGIGDGQGQYAVFVGRLSPEKGIETLLSSWQNLTLPIPLKIVGDGPLHDRVLAAARHDPRIECLGWQSLEKVLELVGSASMLIMPSVWYEIFGRTIVEGFAKGTPAIASRLGAMAELVTHERTGLHFNPGDPTDLAAQVTRLWEDETLRQSMRCNCRQEFESKYTAAANYKQLLEIYQQAMHSESCQSNTAQQPISQMSAETSSVMVAWPRKVDLFGVKVSPTTYTEVVNATIAAATHGQPAIISCHAVHAIVTASNAPDLRDKVNHFDVVTPDGQPVRWALNLLHGAKLRERVYGPELMLRLCQSAAGQGLGIYLYGGTPSSLTRLQSSLLTRFPELKIVGSESPPFRALTAEEDNDVIKRVNDSGAALLFIGLGCPKQDHFAADHRQSIHCVQVCVGAAFDFHAGITPMAPLWMQRRGLEWLYRLCREPRRLWRRYLVTNTQFVMKLACALGSRVLSGESYPEPVPCARSSEPT